MFFDILMPIILFSIGMFLLHLASTNHFIHTFNKNANPFYTILIVKNNADCIEGILRSTIAYNRKYNNTNLFHQILVIDLNSDDDTLLILEKLSRKYDFIQIITNHELENLNIKLNH